MLNTIVDFILSTAGLVDYLYTRWGTSVKAKTSFRFPE